MLSEYKNSAEFTYAGLHAGLVERDQNWVQQPEDDLAEKLATAYVANLFLLDSYPTDESDDRARTSFGVPVECIMYQCARGGNSTVDCKNKRATQAILNSRPDQGYAYENSWETEFDAVARVEDLVMTSVIGTPIVDTRV